MKAAPECVPCTMAKAIRFARERLGDRGAEKALEMALAEVEGALAGAPVDYAMRVYRRLRSLLGEDFLSEEKGRQNERAVEILGHMRGKILSMEDPIRGALLLSAAGNIIDLGAKPDYDIQRTIQKTFNEGFTPDHYPLFRKKLGDSKSVMLIADNAGEVVFDLFLLSLLPVKEKIITLRERPVLNDATPKDIEGLPHTEGIRVMTPGCDCLGVKPKEAAQGWRREFYRADIVIAKGHANLESLWGVDREIFFVSQIKCWVVGRAVGVEPGKAVFLHWRG